MLDRLSKRRFLFVGLIKIDYLCKVIFWSRMENKYIHINGARVNNLKNLEVKIPQGDFVVITGVSGSGKTSLAFDTLYAEGQRRYVESLSSYARQFLGRMAKPECDFIKGLPPAIAIEQKVITRNPRSTVGTTTEIYDYLRMLFARIGHTISPISGNEVKKHSIEDVLKTILSYPIGTRVAILTKISIPENRTFQEQLKILIQEGFSRLELNGEFLDITEVAENYQPTNTVDYQLVIDRLSVSNDKNELNRLTDSIETAFYEGKEECIVCIWHGSEILRHNFSKSFEADGIIFKEPTELMFNFNNPFGACPECEGFGKVIGIDENLVVPNKTLSVYEDAVQCWRGEKMNEWKTFFVNIAPRYDFPIHLPYCQLTEKQKHFLWHGNSEWEGIDGFFKWIDTNQYKIQYRVLKARYRGKTTCNVCNGSRLCKDAEYVKINGFSISEIVKKPITELKLFFDDLKLSESEKTIAKRLLTEINNRIDMLINVGLGYLTLDRLSSSLSGGESQRINLVKSLGSSLVGSLYILDEPSIGLHSRDTNRLLKVIRNLQRLGNTVIVVEHDEEIMLEADHIIDIGPDAGRHGGNLVFSGNLKTALENPNYDVKSYTLDYLSGEKVIDYSPQRRPWRKHIDVIGAAENNLKNIDVRFPLGVMTVVTGVSGSGKSTLVRDILYKALMRYFDQVCETPGTHKELRGDMSSLTAVEFVDQNPIGTSSRSNAATYLKAYDEIRSLFAEQQLAKQMSFTPAFFSFNAEGGRCEECKGEGTVTIPMQFMADITIPCETCHGKRFKRDVLDITYKGKNIDDILNMTINQAIEFFSEEKNSQEAKIIKRLQPLQDVGLGYIKLGQSSSTLSGGESQRVKLAYFISQEKQGETLFIFDEPTTGLHFNDISTLLKSMNKLIAKGHSIIIIEHNMDIIKSADWIIDIGPEGGNEGGTIVAAGTPEEIANCKESHTGNFLKQKLVKKCKK